MGSSSVTVAFGCWVLARDESRGCAAVRGRLAPLMRPSMLQDEWIVPTVAVLKTTGSLFDATNSAVSIDADSIRMTCGSQTRLLRATRESQIEALAWEAVHFMYASIQICPSKLTSFFFRPVVHRARVSPLSGVRPRNPAPLLCGVVSLASKWYTIPAICPRTTDGFMSMCADFF